MDADDVLSGSGRRGIHSAPVRGASDDWITPPEIVKSLGTFGLDPCACRGQFYRTARLMVHPPVNGLMVEWRGRVWLNPPYGQQTRLWLERLAKHGNGIALVPARTEVESWFWPFIWEAATALLFLRGRLYFLTPRGKKRGNAGHGSVLAAYGERNAKRLADSGIPGMFLRIR